ncbi:MAG: hypothetical protein J6J12_00205 [Oscillospiraceae bacterium]|nr:hypothetical protein [Oscillospiraceae bacterium]
MSTPQSMINICSGVRLDNRYEHSIYFPDAEAQRAYFAGKVVKTFSAYSYLRKSWPIQVQATMEQAKTWSYLYFRNGTGKYYYYFITQVEYKNENMVELTLELDVVQTYLFDFTLLPSFVERQHTATDEIGEHTVEEGLDVGELTTNGTGTIDPGKLCIMVMCSINPNVTDEALVTEAKPYMYNRVFSGVKIWAVNPDKWVAWGNQLETLNEIGQIEAISSMWMYPMQFVELGGEATWTDEDIAVPVEKAKSLADAPLVYNLPKQVTTIDGYTPKNKKLFCYPYNFAYCTNNEGTHAVYRYERFQSEGMQFAMSGSLTPGGGVHLTPKNYDGLLNNYHAGINLTGFPTCAWNSDIYKLWLAQNQGQNTVGFLTGALKIAGGVGAAIASGALTATGVGTVPGVAGAGAGIATAVSGAQQIAGMLAQNHDKDIVPPQANGTFSSSVNITDNQLGFSFYYKSVTAEMARVLDDYFTMYGYRLNRVQVPNIHARPSYTYIKTVGCNMQGNLCNADLTQIQRIFDKGVTFWVNGDRIADYTQNNTP